MMLQAIPILAAALFVAWLVAEVQREGRALRIALGILTIATAGIGAYGMASVIPSYERQAHRASLRELGHIAERGDLQHVRKALAIYNDTAASDGSTYTAALKMWEIVSPMTPPLMSPR